MPFEPGPGAPEARSLPSPTSPLERPLAAQDLAHVDPLEILPQAESLAREVHPRAVLIDLSSRPGAVIGGAVDLRPQPCAGQQGCPDTAIDFRYEFLCVDSSGPPGKDKVEGMVTVTAQAGRMRAMASPVAFELTKPGGSPRPAPHCSLAEAWAGARSAGMPANAAATVMYGWMGPPFVWRFTVDGHSELTREIDDANCQPMNGSAMLCGCAAQDSACRLRCLEAERARRSEQPLLPACSAPIEPAAPLTPGRPQGPASTGPKATSPGGAGRAAPPSAGRANSSGPCGCQHDDLMCVMRCNQQHGR
jgi:hypothetical protein